jgi:hypothetical protein
MDRYGPEQLALVEQFLLEIIEATRNARSGMQQEPSGR